MKNTAEAHGSQQAEHKNLLHYRYIFDSWIGADEELWEEESMVIDDNWADYFEFERFKSHDSFRIMADFAQSVDDTKLQDKLINALNRPKPF